MPRIPPQIIRASIKAGSVYYFPEDSFSSEEPHFFVVLNRNPQIDEVIILGCGSSQIEKTLRRRSYCSPETFVIITPEEYEDFSVPTIFDCNSPNNISIEAIMAKYIEGRLDIKTEMDQSLIGKLRQGIIASRQIAPSIKTLL